MKSFVGRWLCWLQRDMSEDPGRQTLQGHANSRSPLTSIWGYISSHNSDSFWGKTEGCPKLTETVSITTAEWGALAPH